MQFLVLGCHLAATRAACGHPLVGSAAVGVIELVSQEHVSDWPIFVLS